LAVRDLETRKILKGFKNVDAKNGVQLTATHLVVSDFKYRLTVHDLITGKPVKGLEGLDARNDFLLTDTHLAVCDSEHHLTIYDFKTGKPLEGLVDLDASVGFYMNSDWAEVSNGGKIDVYYLSDHKVGESAVMESSAQIAENTADMTAEVPPSDADGNMPGIGMETVQIAEDLDAGNITLDDLAGMVSIGQVQEAVAVSAVMQASGAEEAGRFEDMVRGSGIGKTEQDETDSGMAKGGVPVVDAVKPASIAQDEDSIAPMT
jgi:hypothetical protein